MKSQGKAGSGKYIELLKHLQKIQVGGHTKILWIGNGLICKPLDLREREFYRRRPPCLTQFMPEYKGDEAKNLEVGKI